jgi:hypothetical protein
MPNITSSEKPKANYQNAPKKCIAFVLNYSKSYQVVTANNEKIGLALN